METEGTEIVIDPKHKCINCDKKFKIADVVYIDIREHRRCWKCWNGGKHMPPPKFIGVYREADSKTSSIDRQRCSSRLKKIRRSLKKRLLKGAK